MNKWYNEWDVGTYNCIPSLYMRALAFGHVHYTAKILAGWEYDVALNKKGPGITLMHASTDPEKGCFVNVSLIGSSLGQRKQRHGLLMGGCSPDRVS